MFGLRPTKGSVSIEGIEPFCQYDPPIRRILHLDNKWLTSYRVWDTAGLLGRDLQKCRDFAAEWLNQDVLVKSDRPFSEIIWPTDFWEIIDSHQVELAIKFAASIGASLDLASREVSFRDSWAREPPPEAAGLSLQDYIVDVSANTLATIIVT